MKAWINYHHLYYFKVIASLGSIARASESLGLGQPALSAQLKQFEETLSVQLFERKHKKLILTEQGRVCLEYANEIFRLGGELLEVLQDNVQNTKKIHLQIGALDSIPKSIIADLVKEAQKLMPSEITILEGKQEELVLDLTLHKLDLVLSNYAPSKYEGVKLYSKTIAESPIVICGGDRFKSLKKGFPNSLSDAPFLLPTRHSKVRLDVDHFFQANQIKIKLISETQDTSLQKVLGVEGLGLLAIPFHSVQDLIKTKQLHVLGELGTSKEELFLLSASRKKAHPLAQLLMDHFLVQ